MKHSTKWQAKKDVSPAAICNHGLTCSITDYAAEREEEPCFIGDGVKDLLIIKTSYRGG